MGTGGTPTLQSPKSDLLLGGAKISNIDGQQVVCIYNKFYGQAERAISNGQLNALLRLHIRPINVVVFHGPS
jgi:hypothetical protein